MFHRSERQLVGRTIEDELAAMGHFADSLGWLVRESEFPLATTSIVDQGSEPKDYLVILFSVAGSGISHPLPCARSKNCANGKR